MDIPWLICNKCYVFLKNLQSDYFVASCGNIFCKNCAPTIADTCPVCDTKPVQLTPRSRIAEKLKPMFNYTIIPQLQKMIKICTFQNLQANVLACCYDKKIKLYQKALPAYEELVARAKKHHKMLQSAKTAYAELLEKEKLRNQGKLTSQVNFVETTSEGTPGNSTLVLNSLHHLQLNSGHTNAETYMQMARNQQHKVPMHRIAKHQEHQLAMQRTMRNHQYQTPQVSSIKTAHMFERPRTKPELSDTGYSSSTPGSAPISSTSRLIFRQGGFPQRFYAETADRIPRNILQSKRVHNNSSDSDISDTNSRKSQRTPDGVFRIPPTPKSVKFAETKYSKRPFS